MFRKQEKGGGGTIVRRTFFRGARRKASRVVRQHGLRWQFECRASSALPIIRDHTSGIQHGCAWQSRSRSSLFSASSHPSSFSRVLKSDKYPTKTNLMYHQALFSRPSSHQPYSRENPHRRLSTQTPKDQSIRAGKQRLAATGRPEEPVVMLMGASSPKYTSTSTKLMG